MFPRAMAVQRCPCVHMLAIKCTYEHTELSEWPVRGRRDRSSMFYACARPIDKYLSYYFAYTWLLFM